jgi:ribosomal protein S18 acetylase RimI-like enzyme
VVNAEAMAQNAYKVEWLVLEGVEGKRELVEGWRAMLHIDILEGYQRQGWGREMVTSFVESVKEVKEEGRWDVGKGIQLGVAGENTKVVGFYEKLLFRVYPGGEKEGNVWMVRDV